MSRKDRLLEVYEYVRNHFPIHTKNDFAEKLKYHRTYISSAMNGNEKNLTDKLFTNICEAFPNVFNLDYLLYGSGKLLTDKDEPNINNIKNGKISTYVAEELPKPYIPAWADTFIDIFTKQIVENEKLNRQLRISIAEVAELKEQLSQLIKSIKK